MQQALADALRLAHLQAEILTRLDAAEQRGDEAAVQRCHAQLDHVMVRVAIAEKVRTGAQSGPSGSLDLACDSCGAFAEPIYEPARLLGYNCLHCGWTTQLPGVQAEERHAAAKDAAITALGQSIPAIDEAATTLQQRGKKARTDAIAALRTIHDRLVTAEERSRSTAEAL